MKNNHNNISNLIYHLRESSDVMYTIFTAGSCFKLYLILNEVFNNCSPLWSDQDGHCVVKIDNRYYDIGGEIKEQYVADNGYFEIPKNQIKGFSLLKITKLNFDDNDNLRSVVTEKYK